MRGEGIMKRYEVHLSKTPELAFLAGLHTVCSELPWEHTPRTRKSTFRFQMEITAGVPKELLWQTPPKEEEETTSGLEDYSYRQVMAQTPFESAYTWALKHELVKQTGKGGNEYLGLTAKGESYLSSYFYVSTPPRVNLDKMTPPETQEHLRKRKWRDYSKEFGIAIENAARQQAEKGIQSQFRTVVIHPNEVSLS